MNWLDVINTIGLGAVLAAFLYVGRKLQTLDHLQVTSEKIKVNIKVISDYLTSANNDFNHAELRQYSPLRLTPEGKKLITTIGFDQIFKDQKQEFYKFIDNENPKLKYDVEKSAIKAVQVLYAKGCLDNLKVYFYNNPSRNIYNLAPTLGVYVRDIYLSEHTNITE